MLYLHHRVIPISTRIHVIFGNFYTLFGTIFLAFSWIFCVVFLSNIDITSFSFSEDSPQTTAVVNQVRPTNSSVNKRKVYAYDYTYLMQERSFSGTSYESSSNLQEGDSVSIQYLEDKPEVSRIVGMRNDIFDIWVLFVLLFPIVGLIMAYTGVKRGLRAVHLLQHGELTTGKLIASMPTNTSINNRPVYEMKFEFITKEGKKEQVVGKTHEIELLQDEAQERILYLSDRTDIAIVLDEMKGCPRLESADPNRWYPMNGFSAFLYLLPTIIFAMEIVITFLVI